MAVVEVKVIPLGTDQPSISSFVKEAFEVARQEPGVVAALTPTSTVLEGELGHVLRVAQAMHEAPFRRGVDRVSTTITIDERHDKTTDMDEMVAAVIEGDHPR